MSTAARTRQALLHLLLDLSETGVTLAILWRCLAAFRPLALGWFPLALRPLRRWLLPVIGAPPLSHHCMPPHKHAPESKSA